MLISHWHSLKEQEKQHFFIFHGNNKTIFMLKEENVGSEHCYSSWPGSYAIKFVNYCPKVILFATDSYKEISLELGKLLLHKLNWDFTGIY